MNSKGGQGREIGQGKSVLVPLLVVIGTSLLVGCGANAAAPSTSAGGTVTTSSPDRTTDVFGNPVASSSAAPADCPLAFAGWAPANGDKITVIVRLPGPVSVDVTVSGYGPGRLSVVVLP